MSFFLHTLLVLELFGIIIEDFKDRAIWWGWIPVLIITSLGIAISEISLSTLSYFFGMNILFIVLQLILATCWFSIKKRRFINLTKQYLGLGDILFLIPLCLLFSPVNFIIFYMISLIVILIFFMTLNVIIDDKIKTIPLAGAIAICFIAGSLFSWDRYSDDIILNHFTTYLLIW